MITASITDIKPLLASYLKRKDQVIGNKLKTKMIESMEYIRQKIADYAPKKNGKLQRTILSLPISGGGLKTSSFSLSSDGRLECNFRFIRKIDQQILWVDRGTGVYGPSRRVIRPRSSKYLYYEIDGKLFRSKTIKGQRGKKFITRGLNASRLIVISKIRSALKG